MRNFYQLFDVVFGKKFKKNRAIGRLAVFCFVNLGFEPRNYF